MLLNEKNIVKLITLGPIIFIPSVVLMFMLLIIKTQNDNYADAVQHSVNEIKRHQEVSVKTRVQGISNLIAYQQSIIKENLQKRIQRRVYNAYQIASSIYEQNVDKKNSSEIKKMIVETLRPLIWNGGESFIWIIDYDGIFQLAPYYLRRLEHSSVINTKDLNGREVIKEEIAICKNSGEGFLWDTFTKPGSASSKQYKQVAFVKAFHHYNWYLGSAEYLNTASKKTDFELLNTVDKINNLKENYIYIINTKGDVLLNPALAKNSKINILHTNDPALQAVSHEIFHNLKNKDQAFIQYKWKNETTKQDDLKFAYVQKVPNTSWIIGSGFYQSKLNGLAQKRIQKLYSSYQSNYAKLLYLTIFLILVSLFISYFISKYVAKSYKRYNEDISAKTNQLQHLNDTLEQKVQERTQELEVITHKLEYLATIDSLTEIHNRYSIMNILQTEMSRAKRHQNSLCVSMFDIDYFKNVNDTFGHDVGDYVLHTIAAITKNTLREIDYVGRYGGEEFLIVLPNTSFNDAKNIIERLRLKIAQYPFKNADHVTISLGLVNYNSQENLDQLFIRLKTKRTKYA